MPLHDPRTAELAKRLGAVRQRIATVVAGSQPRASAGSPTTEPTLIVVTKFHPGADVVRLRELGVVDVGENRDQEAAAKALEVADPGLRWHFVGQLQSNKAKSVAAYAHSVHSIDRGSVAAALGKAMVRQQLLDGRADLECFIQVELTGPYGALVAGGQSPTAGPGGRGGAAPSYVLELADSIAGTPGLVLAGVMGVAPLGATPEPAFQLLAEVSARLRSAHPGATGISAGMSHDLEAALAAGATHLRVGSDILGPRPAVL
ncbi:alanine racemase [Arthrobacter sp. H35-D1]|uniref:YggS family pyridoxal phosphate enzyme n=1 Tax=Arthrobacter sp. H35-D1 TaxID=3046202 RepID=UPI0024BB1A59|nr:alanine racemase [Arthrobacter sp. H35-D1]MDJ0313242.1 alanine racemase [Arthrobacter sp. H35-D1]